MWLTEDDGYDGIQYDTEHAPGPRQLEADEIRRDILAGTHRAPVMPVRTTAAEYDQAMTDAAERHSNGEENER